MHLCDEADGSVLEVKDGGGVPVLGGVHVALRGGRHDEEAVAQRCLDYPVAELELLPGVVCHVSEGDALPPYRCISIFYVLNIYRNFQLPIFGSISNSIEYSTQEFYVKLKMII